MFKIRILETNFKTLPLFYHVSIYTIIHKLSQLANSLLVNKVYIDARTEQICKLKYSLKNTVLNAKEIEKVRLPNATVKVDSNGELNLKSRCYPSNVSIWNVEYHMND